MTTRVPKFSMRLPVSRKTLAESFFAERKGRGDPEAAIRFLTRAGGEPPRPGDEMPG